MGLFSRIKSELNHGGVKLQLQAPASTAAGQIVPVTVTVTSDTTHVVSKITARIEAQAKEQGMVMGRQGTGLESSETTFQTVAEVQSAESFTINPGETKTVSLQLALSTTSTAGGLGGPNPSGAVAQVIGAAMAAVQPFEHVNFVYRVHVTADVEGVGLDPSAKQPIQVLSPAGPAGGAVS